MFPLWLGGCRFFPATDARLGPQAVATHRNAWGSFLLLKTKRSTECGAHSVIPVTASPLRLQNI
jgi:hypothetical protein